MSPNPWDEFPNPTGDFVEFNNVGDEFAGTIKSIGVKVWDDGKKSPQLVCAPDGGAEDVTLTVSWVMLLSAFKKEAPSVGDHIRVKWTAVGPKPKETREWNLVVTRAGAAAPVVEITPEVTPEQLAAMKAAMAPAWDSDPRVAALRGMGIADDAIRSTLGI